MFTVKKLQKNIKVELDCIEYASNKRKTYCEIHKDIRSVDFNNQNFLIIENNNDETHAYKRDDVVKVTCWTVYPQEECEPDEFE